MYMSRIVFSHAYEWRWTTFRVAVETLSISIACDDTDQLHLSSEYVENAQQGVLVSFI
jgi:hypothetical protein